MIQGPNAATDIVYAIHNFEAENEDEIAFSIGEPVIVLQGDDGFNDGWWQGRNVHGEIGLFPINYTSPVEPSEKLEKSIETLEDTITRMQGEPTSLPTPSTSTTSARQSMEPPALSPSKSDFSMDSELSMQSRKPLAAAPSRMTLASKGLQKMILTTLSLPVLQNTSPENWDVSQVIHWLSAMGYESVAEEFQAQEISGDILLELTLDSLKEELNVRTYGKRFKIHCAICALREEALRQQYIYSMNSSWDSSSINTDDYQSTITQRHGAGSRRKVRRDDFGSVQQLYPENDPMLSDNDFDDRDSTRDLPHFGERRSRRSKSASVERRSFAEPRMTRRRTHTDTTMKDSELKSIESISQHSYLPTTKPQAVLQVATRYSMDSIYHRIGFPESNVTPDMEGWLHKQGDRYKTWNKRWFVLKGPNLFYFKSPKDVRMKGIINLRGYRIVCDETISPGNYSFKAQHDRERTFYFHTETETSMRAWIKALMKATISRDFNAPVLSSTTIPTVTLDIARRMNPRPPSILLYRKENRTVTKNWLESIADDASSVASEMREPTLQTHESEASLQPVTHDSAISSNADASAADAKEEMQDSGFDSTHKRISSSLSCGQDDGMLAVIEAEDGDSGEVVWTSADYVDWICEATGKSLNDLGELRSGDTLIELLQQLSHKQVSTPTSDSGSVSMMMLDKLVSAFKFMSREGVPVEGRVTIKDIFGGNQAKIMDMLDCIRVTFANARLEAALD